MTKNMKTKNNQDVIIKGENDAHYFGVIADVFYAQWDRMTGACVHPAGCAWLDLAIEQKPDTRLPDPTRQIGIIIRLLITA